jgi:hypothetical protein
MGPRYRCIVGDPGSEDAKGTLQGKAYVLWGYRVDGDGTQHFGWLIGQFWWRWWRWWRSTDRAYGKSGAVHFAPSRDARHISDHSNRLGQTRDERLPQQAVLDFRCHLPLSGIPAALKLLIQAALLESHLENIES